MAEASHSFGDLESVQRTLDGLVQADAAASAFLSGYTTYIRTHARASADVLTGRLPVVEESRLALAKALEEQVSSVAARENARARQHSAENEGVALVARLDAHKASTAYRGRGQLIKLAEMVAKQQAAARRDREAADRAMAELDRRRRARQSADSAAQEALAAVTRAAGHVLQAARDAGIDWQSPDSADDGGLPVRASARATVRSADVTAIRRLTGRADDARRYRDSAQVRSDRAQEKLAVAERDVGEARQTLESARATIAVALQELVTASSAVLPGYAADALTAALDQLGTGDAPTLQTVFDQQLAGIVQDLRDQLAKDREALQRNDDQMAVLRSEYTAIAAEQDEAPPPFAARTAARDGRVGAPLWAMVTARIARRRSPASPLRAKPRPT